MKVLLLNGSPHKNGCTFTALSEVAKALKENGIDSEFFHIGSRPIQGCIACWKCRETGNGCVFKEQLYTEFTGKMKECDGLVIGAPVYYAGPPEACARFLTARFSPLPRCFRERPPHVSLIAGAAGRVRRLTV